MSQFPEDYVNPPELPEPPKDEDFFECERCGVKSALVGIDDPESVWSCEAYSEITS